MIKEIYYKLTKYLPRRLPETPEDYEALKRTLSKYYGLPDEDKVWLTIAGQISGTPPTKISRSYASLANAGRRLNINKIAHDEKLKSIEKLEAKLQELQKRVDEEAKSSQEAVNGSAVREESSDPSTPLQVLQNTTDSVV